ncbi:lipoxygenase homology domain-containing protein 1-like [Saccostrea echinata]|uniref:lipoxygenase homology domain-containing protein 1-like n=1 Tax=Saccostrea echinata TaxID=191078 RepID=UPI002A82C143|nr:lipoxygenase homology domain-containing protein 1-like [Saccostrea echinata]
MDKKTKDTKKKDGKFVSAAADDGDGAKDRNPKRAQKAEAKDVKPPTERKKPKHVGNDSKSVVEMGTRKDTVSPNLRSSQTAGNDTKTCYFFKDEDYRFPGVKIALNPRKYKKFDTLCLELSRKIPGLGFGVRSVTTPTGHTRISNLDALTHEGKYICSSSRVHVRGLDMSRVGGREVWHFARPPSGRRLLNQILREDGEFREPRFKKSKKPYDMATVYNRNQPKKITVLKNGDPTYRHVLLLNRRTAQQFEQVLYDLSEMFKFAVRKLCTTEGKRIGGLNQLFMGPDTVVCCGSEPFKHMDGSGYYATPRIMSRVSLNTRGSDPVASRMKMKRNRLTNTKGEWKVTVKTNGHPSASTQAQVTITVYGHKGNSGPISLGSGDGSNFKSGSTDDFDISVGNVGEIYKIRIAHDNSGDSPGWLCDEIKMKDKDTDEELTFTCRRWLARDEDDYEICRELPAVRKGEPILPVVRYNVYVTTGNLWGASTEANVYMTMYGDRGDTGVRQLYSPSKGCFQQGRTDTFTVEAVSLGHLKRIIVGHDGTGGGNGWYLEKIVVKEPSGSKMHDESVFHCGKWLDEGQDDGKIVRELKVQEEYMDDILEKRNWEYEKWKFEKDCQVKLYSLASGKAIRIKQNGAIDALGNDLDFHAVFNVVQRKVMVRMFNSVPDPNSFISIDNGKMVMHKGSGPYCEFRLRVQGDRSIMFESVKNPLQFLTFGEDGHPEDVRGILDKEKTRRFYVYCKGMFRHRGVVIFSTSLYQAININSDLSMTALGTPSSKMAQFRVHKVTENGVRMFESISHPGKYIRLKDGKIDCQGIRDEASHFIVEKRRAGGYVSLQSASQRGLYLGMKPDGRIWPTVDTGVNNVHLYPQVVEWGARKTPSIAEVEEEEEMEPAITESPLIATPQPIKPGHAVFLTEDAQYRVGEDDWNIHVSTIEELMNAEVALVAYGDNGNSGAIRLEAPPGREIFQPNNEDGFRSTLKVGKFYKIRLELLPKSSSKKPSWKVNEVRLTNVVTEQTFVFTFNRWLSREHEDMEIMRELPAIWPGEETPPVFKYYVLVHTGDVDEAETNAEVYLNIFGETGDTGKRVLLNSNNINKFRSGQVDIFEIEAVSLGKLEKCIVGHDGTGTDQGWFLDRITIRESEESKEEYIFPCEKWLDVNKEDRRIERTLAVKEVLPVQVDTIIEEDEENTIKEGDWKIWITTGKEESMATSNMVFLYAYGTNGSAGPLKLGNGKDGFFRAGTTDIIKMSFGSGAGQVYKIRIGHNEAYPESGWFLERLKLQDCSNGDEFNIEVNRWLSRSHDDGDVWREFAISQIGKVLPVVTYSVEVYTGSEEAASTTAGVFICIYGTRGDTGKRKLFKSKTSNDPFQKGAHDVFELEAVSLDEVDHIVIGHDKKGSDPSWFLDKVIIRSEEKPDKDYRFTCDRWLSETEGDGKCEVELTPGWFTEKATKSRGEFSLSVKTSEDSSPAGGGKVDLAVYGENGKSEDITLTAPSPGDKLFEPGNIDSFTINVGDIGNLYKIRVSREDLHTWKAWHLEELKLQDLDTSEVFLVRCDRWLSREKDDFDLTREFPIIHKNKPPPQVQQFEVEIMTGNHWAAETDADIFVTIFGDKGDTGRRKLYHSLQEGDKFQRGKVDKFLFEAVSLGKLNQVQIGHDNKGHGAGVYIEDVKVTEKSSPDVQYVFPCRSWLDEREGDKRTWRVLPMLEKRDPSKRPPQKDLKKKSKGKWSVTVKTSEEKDSGTSAQVYLTAFGTKGQSQKQPLGSGQQGQSEFTPGAVSEFNVDFGDIGELLKIRLEHNNKNDSASWHVDWVEMTDVDTNEHHKIFINRWFSVDEEDGQVVREFSVDHPGDMPLPVCQYVILVQTSMTSDPGSSEGQVSINIQGEYGDTGERKLSGKSPWKPGEEASFIIESISLGALKKIQLQFEGQGMSWLVDRVRIFEKPTAISQTVFNCHSLFDMRSGDKRVSKEFPAAAVQPCEVPTKVVERFYGDISPLVSKGHWRILVECGKNGTEDDIFLVVYGVKGHSTPYHINSKENLSPGALIISDLNVGDIGAIFKIHLYFGGDFTGTPWFLNKLKLKDADTKQQFMFTHNKLIEPTTDNPTGLVELPAIRPDLAPLQEDEFTLYVSTGNLHLADTSADVSCNLIGEWGNTGSRLLAKSTNQVPFRQGQVDEFKVRGLELGKLREVVVSHTERGRGRGWFCDRVVVKSTLSNVLKVFPCNQWLDTGCEDRQLVRRLRPLGQMPVSNPPVTGKSKGVWVCSVKTADIDQLPDVARNRSSKSREVSLTVYGSDSVHGPVELISLQGEPFLPGQTDTFSDLTFGDLGRIQKVRVSAGYEQDPDTVWTIEKVTLKDQDTGEILEFDFSRWIGELGGDIRKELPVIKMGQGIKQVLPYYIQLFTSDEEMDAGTESHMFITLYGQEADTGRRHLHNNGRKNFQTGQVDSFTVEAVDLGELEKIVIAKGPGSPWLLDKVVVKESEYSAVQYNFLHGKWIGSKDTKKQEIEETIRLSTTEPSVVVIPANQVSDLPQSNGAWKISTDTGGQKGGVPLDLVVTFIGSEGESELCPLKSSRENPFQIGQKDVCEIKFAADIGELYKLRLGYLDNTKKKGWLLRRITCEDSETGDMFTYDLNDWVIVDEKSDGWREIPVHWPALPIPRVLKYQVITYLGDVHRAGTDSNVFVCLYGSLSSSGKRLLKHSLTNKDRFTQDQVDQFEVEAVDLGTLQKVVIGHDSQGEGSGWYLKKVVVMDSIDSVDKFVFPCNHWLDEGEEDAKIERTLLLSEEVVLEDDISPTPQVKSPSPVARQKSETPAPREKTKTPTPTPRQKTKTPIPVSREKSNSPKPTPLEKVKTPSPPPKQKTKSPSPTPLKSPSPPLVVASEDVSDKVDSPKPETPKPTSPEQEKTASPGAGGEKLVSPKPDPPTADEEKVKKSDTPEDEEPKSEIPEKKDSDKPEDLESKPEIQEDKPDEVKVTAEQTDQQTAGPEKAVEENKSPTPPPQEGTVKVFVTTSAAPDCGTNDQVTLTVYGDAGNSGPLSLGEPNKGYFQPGQTDEFLVNFDTEELGGIRKIRIEHDNPQTQSGWGLDKVILHNLKSDERYEFHVGKHLSFSGEYGDIAVEVPAENESHDFWPVRHYMVTIETGTEENSGTDATVHITLFGTLGDTGRRYLINNKEQNKKFRTGKVDTFIVEAVDLGRLENIIIGHDGKGAEAAWFLEKVSVKEGVDAKHKYIFTCNSWLQDEEDYGIVEVELYMDRMEKENSNLQKQNLNIVDGEDSERETGGQGRKEDIKEDMESMQGQGIKEDEVTDTSKEEEIKQGQENIQGEGVTENTNKIEDDKSGIKDKTEIGNENSAPEDNDVDLNKSESEDIYKTESGNQDKITEDSDVDNDKRNEDTIKAKNEDQSDVTEDSNVENKMEREDTKKTESEDTKKIESENTKKTESEDTNKTESEDTNKTESEDTSKIESEDQNKATEDKS